MLKPLTITEIRQEIELLLATSPDKHLSGCMDSITDNQVQALWAYLENNTVDEIIIAHVIYDVTAIVSGHPEDIWYSLPFLNPES